jgi:hypothetical protein
MFTLKDKDAFPEMVEDPAAAIKLLPGGPEALEAVGEMKKKLFNLEMGGGMLHLPA